VGGAAGITVAVIAFGPRGVLGGKELGDAETFDLGGMEACDIFGESPKDSLLAGARGILLARGMVALGGTGLSEGIDLAGDATTGGLCSLRGAVGAAGRNGGGVSLTADLGSSESCGCLLACNKAFGMVGGVAFLACGDGVTGALLGVMVGMLPN
jgi:hypothetical protein